MKRLLTVFALLALTMPAVAEAAPQAGTLASTVTTEAQIGFTADQAIDGIAQASDGTAVSFDGVQLAQRVVRGRRGRAVVVGPRGRVIAGPRTFVFRGRTVNAFRARPFVYPRGFAYRRWSPGLLFPAALIAAPFFFAEYETLGLQRPPPGYRWVRYGPDVVLVNMRTREVEDVAYGAIDEDEGFE